MNQLISIILPVYNRENFIEECIRSALDQSYSHFEIIVIDDGSTDRSGEICRRLAAGDSRIRLLAGDHAGVSAARNLGLEAARGDFLFFLDSDDVIHPRLLEALTSGAQAHGAAVSAAPVVKVPDKDWHKVARSIEMDHRPPESTYLAPEQTLRAFMTTSCALSVIGGVMLRRELVGDTRFRTDFHIGEDFYFLYENLTKDADAVLLKHNWYYVRIHDCNSSWDYSYDGFRNRLLRRQLVWEREEALGRKEFADLQKQGALSVYLRCQCHHPILSRACKMMRRDLRRLQKCLLPALPPKQKISFLLALYLPPVHRLTFRLWAKH